MSDIVKWGILIAAVVVIVALMAGIFSLLNVATVGTAFASGVQSVVATCGGGFQAARGFLNRLAPPLLWDMVLAVALLIPFLRLSVKITVMAYRWIFK